VNVDGDLVEETVDADTPPMLDSHKYMSFPDEASLTFRGDEIEFMLNVFHRLNEQMSVARANKRMSARTIEYMQGLADSAAIVYSSILNQLKASKANSDIAN
jgi:hypothetical protein